MQNLSQIKPKEKFQEELNKRFPKNDVTILEYTKSSGPITYQCNQCGRIYKKSRANHLYKNVTLCTSCYSGKTSRMRENFLYMIERDGFELLDNPNKALNLKFHIKCLKCGREYDYKVQDIKKLSCRYCETNGHPVDQIEFQKRINFLGEPYTDFEILNYKRATSSMTLKHKKCGYVFSRLPFNFIKYPTCPKCHPHATKGERAIAKFLIENKINFVFQKRFEEIKNLRFDFWLPDYNLAIEFQGEQHYHPIPHFGGEEKFKSRQQHDEQKRIFCKEKGYKLLEISYKDYDKIPKILKSSTTISEESRDKHPEVESTL